MLALSVAPLPQPETWRGAEAVSLTLSLTLVVRASVFKR